MIDAARYLGIHPRTLRRWAKNGNFKLTRIGRRKYVEANEIRSFLAGELGPFKVKAERSPENVIDTIKLITVPRAALCLDVHFTTIYRWIKIEKLHPITVGWQMYLTTEEVQALKAHLDFKKEKH